MASSPYVIDATLNNNKDLFSDDEDDEKNTNTHMYINKIPIKYASYDVVVVFPFMEFTVSKKTLISFIAENSTDSDINAEERLLKFTMKIDKSNYYVFNKIFDHCSNNISIIFDGIRLAFAYYNSDNSDNPHRYEISSKINSIIDAYISKLGQSSEIWKNLTDKPDYNLTIFQHRTLPYFNLECKEWIKANIDTTNNNADYPPSMTNARPNTNDDFALETNLVTRNNNYMAWRILPIVNYPNIDKLSDRVLLLHSLGLEKQALKMLLKLMLSPRHAHIIKCSNLWHLYKPLMENNANLYNIIQYCFYFAMYVLRQEETIMFSRVKTGYRVMFSLEEASMLPTFSKSHIEQSPYILQLTSDTKLHSCMPFYLIGDRKINNRSEFDRRFDLATGGAFRNIDLESLGVSITGSILIPCVHTSPLESQFTDVVWDRSRKKHIKYQFQIDEPNKEDIPFLNYLEYYYPSYVSLSDEDYDKKVCCEKESAIYNNTMKYESDSDDDDTSTPAMEDSKTSLISANERELSQIMKPNAVPKVGYNQLADIDISITVSSYVEFENSAMELFKGVKKNCEHRGPVYYEVVKTIASTKYKFYGPGLPRPMDVFSIPYTPAKMVKKFHVPCVRMYYNNNITMFRACIASLLSGANDSYKWFSCNKIPIDVLLKYAQRGITTILNQKERSATNKFLLGDKRWGSMLKKIEMSPDKMYCCVTAKHPFFKPDMFNCGIRQGLRDFKLPPVDHPVSSHVIPEVISQTPFGDLLIKDNNKQYPPNYSVINEYFEYITECEYEDDM